MVQTLGADARPIDGVLETIGCRARRAAEKLPYRRFGRRIQGPAATAPHVWTALQVWLKPRGLQERIGLCEDHGGAPPHVKGWAQMLPNLAGLRSSRLQLNMLCSRFTPHTTL